MNATAAVDRRVLTATAAAAGPISFVLLLCVYVYFLLLFSVFFPITCSPTTPPLGPPPPIPSNHLPSRHIYILYIFYMFKLFHARPAVAAVIVWQNYITHARRVIHNIIYYVCYTFLNISRINYYYIISLHIVYFGRHRVVFFYDNRSMSFRIMHSYTHAYSYTSVSR